MPIKKTPSVKTVDFSKEVIPQPEVSTENTNENKTIDMGTTGVVHFTIS